MRFTYIIVSTVACLTINLNLSNANAAGSKAFRSYGDYTQRVLPLAGLAATLVDEDYEGSKQWLRLMTADVAMVYATKRGFNSTKWGERPKNNGNESFVSGHTSYACAGSAFIGKRYGWEYGVPAFALAAGVGASRVNADKHHWRDVIAGCAMSYALAEIFVTKKGMEDVIPVIGPDFLGMRFHWDY